MLWHVVKFRLQADLDAAAREDFAQMLAALADTVPSLRCVRVAPSIDEPDVLALLTGFDDREGLEAYKVHPTHVPVIERAREIAAEIVRLDFVTDDPADILPLRA